VEAYAYQYPVQLLCRVLGVSRSAYYSWKQHKQGLGAAGENKKAIKQQVISIFKEHRRRYGARRIAAELKAREVKAGVYKVGKILREQGLKAIQPRSFVPKTTDSRHPYPISPNLLLERSLPQRPDQVWVGDITYIPLSGGTYGYLAVWIDLYSRKIVGWQLDDNMKEALIVRAFKKALMSRSISKELIVHSDRGGQYAGNKFRKLLHSKPQLVQSMSRADNAYDNAFMESCFSRFKTELLQNGAFDNLQDAYTEIFEFVEMYYNTTRSHSSLNYECPNNFEKNYYTNLAANKSPV
jgi:transposase InsO family protein